MSPALPRVSVVTPFYNTADYLAECIESVLAQTHGDFEYILHDNASTDGSTEIARDYAAKDKRIRYVRLDELIPQIPNYNRSFEQIGADSHWCKMVQADDWIDKRCLAEMVAVGEQSPRIGIVSSFRRRENDLLGSGPDYRQTVFTGRELVRAELLSKFYVLGSPTTVMFRSDVVRGRRPFFPLGCLAADTQACYQILRGWDCGFVHQVLSFSRRQPGSYFRTLVEQDGHILGEVVALQLYGAEFLTKAEMQWRWRSACDTYYSRLGQALLKARPREYWRLHGEGLRGAGLQIERSRVATNAAAHAVRALLRPSLMKEVLQEWAAALRRSRPQRAPTASPTTPR